MCSSFTRVEKISVFSLVVNHLTIIFEMPRTKHLGKGAIVSALLKFLHPSELIRNKYQNPVHGHQLSGCIALWQEVKKVNRKEQLCVVVHHEEFKTGDKYDELHAVVKHWKVHTDLSPKDKNQKGNNKNMSRLHCQQPLMICFPIKQHTEQE